MKKNVIEESFKYSYLVVVIIVLATCVKLEKKIAVSTGTVSKITTSTAEATGYIIDLGEGIVQHGHCYGTSPNVNVNGFRTQHGSPAGNGGFTSQITNLTPGTTYYLKAYASDGVNASYGIEISFTTTTVSSLPTLTTTAVTSVTQTSASSGGNITSDGGAEVTARGVCWSTSATPTTAGSKTSDLTGTGSFTSTLTGLTAGTNYYVRAYATNSVGTAYGNERPFTTAGVTTTVPGAPTIGTATAGNAQATVTFTAPANNGGSAITGYTVTSNPGNKTGTGTASPITVTDLTNGTAYTFTVTATNANGTGPASSPSNSVIPSTVPGPPSIGTATAGNAQATVTFTAPASNGGSVITGYTVTSNPGNKTGTGTASPITVTDLTNGTAYTFTVTATNANGTGPASSASNSVTPSAVQSPVLSGPSSATASFSLTWTFTWPGSTASDDHYELEWSYSSTSGFQVLSTYPNGVRTSPYNVVITPEAVDVGKTTYFRVRAKSAGSYSPYSNIIGVSTPYLNLTFNPAIDNLTMKQSNNTSVENTVYSTTSLGVGGNYIIGVYANDYLIGSSALYFNIDNFISGGTVQKAILRLYVQNLPGDWNTNYIVNALAAAWNTNTLTFANMPSYFTTPFTIKAPPTTGAIPWEVDITAIVQDWADGVKVNYGIIIRDNNIVWPTSTAYRSTDFYSIETAPTADKKPVVYIELR
jgi:hypothetical protein